MPVSFVPDGPAGGMPLTPALARLSGVIDGLDAAQRDAARAYARQLALFAELIPVIASRREERTAAVDRRQSVWLADREVIADVAASLRVSERVVHARMTRARQVREVFPAVHDALAAGAIDPRHADVICEVGVVLDSTAVDDPTRARYAAIGVEAAGVETASRLRGILTAVVSSMVPERVEEQVADAALSKRLSVFDVAPGLARLALDGPTAEIHGIYDRATRQADRIRELNEQAAACTATRADAPVGGGGPGDPGIVDERTLEQIRADVVIDTLLTGTPAAPGRTEAEREELGRIRGHVTVTIPASTVAGSTTGGAIVAGHGPIDEATAKRLAGDATLWLRVFTDPVAGTPIAVDTYKPCTAQRRFLTVRDDHCRFPGCRRPAVKCHIDHNIRHRDDGPTALWNLAHFCEGHHIVKHHTDWTVRQIDGGVLIWTSPTRRTYTDRPPGMSASTHPDAPNGTGRVRFEPSDPADPPGF